MTEMQTRNDTAMDFQVSLVERGRSAATARLYSDQIRRLHKWTATPQADMGANADIIARWINQGREAGDGAATTRQKLAAARAYLRWLGEDLGPLGDYKAPPLPAPAPHPLPGGMADVERMLDRAAAEYTRPWLRTVVALGGYAGLRISESRSVTWQNYDTNRRELTVRGKGDKTRVVPVSTKLRKILADAPRPSIDGTIALAPTDSVVRKAITRLAYDIGLDDVSSHDLRATWATELYKATKDVMLVSRLLGHSSIATTQSYLGFDPQAAALAVDAL